MDPRCRTPAVVRRLTFTTLVLLAVGGVGSAAARGDDPAAEADPTDHATLCQRLDRDYADLLDREPHPEPIREAAGLLAGTNRNSRWADYFKAVELLRQHRSKAAIPLLMKYMVEHATFGGGNAAAYADAIGILAGERVDPPPAQGKDRQAAADRAVLKLYVDWWKPNRRTLTVDLREMGEDRLKVVVADLLAHSEKQLGRRGGGRNRDVPTQARYEGLAYALAEQGGRQEWWDEELDRRMTPVLLAEVGYAAKPTADPTGGSTRVDFDAVPLLAALRKDGDAPTLDKIAEDPRQDDATRLTCLLAVHAAGDTVHSDTALEIYAADTRLECRTVALLAVGSCDRAADAVPKLVGALDDANQNVRLAALYSLRTVDPKAAVPKLTKVLHDGEPADLVEPGIMLLGKVGGDDAAKVLVASMEKTLAAGGNDRSRLLRSLIALDEATGAKWIEAGAHDPAYYEDRAREAVRAWRADHP